MWRVEDVWGWPVVSFFFENKKKTFFLFQLHILRNLFLFLKYNLVTFIIFLFIWNQAECFIVKKNWVVLYIFKFNSAKINFNMTTTRFYLTDLQLFLPRIIHPPENSLQVFFTPRLCTPEYFTPGLLFFHSRIFFSSKSKQNKNSSKHFRQQFCVRGSAPP